MRVRGQGSGSSANSLKHLSASSFVVSRALFLTLCIMGDQTNAVGGQPSAGLVESLVSGSSLLGDGVGIKFASKGTEESQSHESLNLI